VADRFQFTGNWHTTDKIQKQKVMTTYHEAKNTVQVTYCRQRKILGLVISTIEVEEHQARAEKLN
jgi:hypothetical protein